MGEHGGAFAGLSPDELVDWQWCHRESYELLDLVQDYVREKEGRPSYKQRIYTCIRGFFRLNRAKLPDDPDFSVDYEVPVTVGTLYVEELIQSVTASLGLALEPTPQEPPLVTREDVSSH